MVFNRKSKTQNRKWAGIFAIVLTLTVCETRAEAQQPEKVPRIGYLNAVAPSTGSDRIEALRQGLRELEYVEGKNIIIEARYAEGKLDRLPALANELVCLKVDVIVTSGPLPTRVTKQATTSIPIVMAQDADPVGNGFVASLGRPGGNITGLSAQRPELAGKQLELLKEIIPKLSRLSVLGTSSQPGNAQSLKEMEIAAGAFRVKLQFLDILVPKDIDGAFRAAGKAQADAVIMIVPSSVGGSHRKEIVELAIKSRLPATYPQRCEACQLAGRTTDEVRVLHQSKSRQAGRPDNSAQRAGAGGSGDQMTESAGRDRKSTTARMTKRMILLALCSLLVAPCSPAESQQRKKVTRIGYLSSQDPVRESPRSEAIRLALRDLGHIEGQNVAIQYRYAEGKVDRATHLAAELVRLKVDVIVVTGGGGFIRAAKDATGINAIPIVIVGVGIDPAAAGLVQSLARPGGNVTGLTLLFRELGGKRLELLKEAVPKLDTVAVLFDPTNSVGALEVKNVLPVAARALGLTLQPREVRAEEEFEKLFAALTKQRPDGLYAHPTGPLIFANQNRLAAFALQTRIPSVYYNREAVNAGGLMYYGADFADSYRRIAWYVDRILKGAKPADLPVEQPTKFELVINLKTAKQIGLTIPSNVLGRADKIIK